MSVKKRFKKQLENLSNKKYLKESPPIPKLMHIELSNACNHACLFCSNPLMQRKKKIADDKLGVAIDRLRQNADLKLLELENKLRGIR